MPTDWWPEFSPRAHLSTPVLRLKEQAEILKQKTEGLVTASVVADGEEDGSFKVIFLLGSPRLEHYQFRLLELRYPPNNYPVQIRAGDQLLEAKNESELGRQLNKALSSKRTKE